MSLERRLELTKLDNNFSSAGFATVKFFRKDQNITIPTERGNIGKFPHTALLGETTERDITAIIAVNPVRVDAGSLTMMPVPKEIEIFGDSGTLGLPPKGYEKEARAVTREVVQDIFSDHRVSCIKELNSSVSQKKGRALHDVGSILSEHGVSLKEADSPLHKKTLEGFFSEVNLSPESPLGKYVRVRVVEEDAARALTSMVRNRQSIKSIETRKEVLDAIRWVRKKIGEEIFEDKQDEFHTPLEKTLFNLPAHSKSQRDHRAEARKQLVAEIHEQFPSASE